MVSLSAEALPVASEPIELPEEGLRWSSITLREAVESELRLKAAVFGIEGRHARELLAECRWPTTTVAGEGGLARASYPPRFKRVWVEQSEYAIYQPGQINDLNPRPSVYLSPITRTNIDDLRVSRGQIVMTRSGRSGSIGRTAYVSEALHDRIFSDDLIRIECREPDTVGYLCAFLSTKTGRALVKSNEYGAMIPHIEPSHLESVPVPDPPAILKRRIHDLVMQSYSLRDESNALLDEAARLLYDALELPPLTKLDPHAFDKKAGLRNYVVSVSQLGGRLNASYHVPIVDAIMRHLKEKASEVTTIGDSSISKRVILPGRFARVYVEEGQGVPFFGGKQIYQLDPTDRKFLSLKLQGARVREQLALEEGMILVTRSGTIGNVALSPRHWTGLAASEHIIRIVPATLDVAGFLYVFLSTEYGRELITRFSYGSTVPEIDAQHMSEVPVPLLNDKSIQAEINRLALEASTKRTEAYHAEQMAIQVTNDEVIRATRGGAI